VLQFLCIVNLLYHLNLNFKAIFLNYSFFFSLRRERKLGLIPMPDEMAIKLLEESVGKVVLVKLKGGKSIRGILQGFDQHMNLLLGDAEDITISDKVDRLGTIIVRGDNVILISPPKS